ncbi:MAG: hypothetical protein RRX92_09685 [Lachnospiraceae bacterium]
MEKNLLEYELPDFLRDSIDMYEKNKDSSLWDCYYCELQSNINIAETEDLISEEQAWYLRNEYLKIKKESEI